MYTKSRIMKLHLLYIYVILNVWIEFEQKCKIEHLWLKVCLGLCSVVGVWYILKKHWLANDLLGMAFAINGVELLHLNNVVTGCILLGGLFFYDIFWVFGTDVMVTVAKSFEAPIKLVFPQVRSWHFIASSTKVLKLGSSGKRTDGRNQLRHAWPRRHCHTWNLHRTSTQVGRLLLDLSQLYLHRYDNSLKRNSNFYFTATFIGKFSQECCLFNLTHLVSLSRRPPPHHLCDARLQARPARPALPCTCLSR